MRSCTARMLAAKRAVLISRTGRLMTPTPLGVSSGDRDQLRHRQAGHRAPPRECRSRRPASAEVRDLDAGLRLPASCRSITQTSIATRPMIGRSTPLISTWAALPRLRTIPWAYPL